LALPAAAAATDAVLVVGDSLEVGTAPYLRQELGGTPVTVDARIGRPSGEGLRVLASRLRPEHRVVVFDLGVNDNPAQPGGLASDLAAARRLAGDRCVVVATLERLPLNGVDVDGLNRAVKGFAARTSGVQLVDWQSAVMSDPGLLNPDHLHPKPDGYALRGRLVAEGVQACLAGGATSAVAPKAPPAGVVQAPPRPLLIDWTALGGMRPVSGVLGLLSGGAGALLGAGARLNSLASGGAEPVLGKP
jgi:lysophospholipase L1-like esterase